VLGKEVADALFPDNPDPTGEYVLVDRFPFLVVGVMSERGSTGFGGNQDDTILIPLSTGMLRLFGQQTLRSITVTVEDTDLIDQVAADILGLLIQRHGSEDVTIRNNAALLETVSETQDTFSILLGSVAAISLLVGGIGVMNIMLVNVTERRREIGIRMATGARMRDILRQFNSEAVVVSLLGGLIGTAVGLGVGAALGEFGVSVAFKALPVILAFSSALLTGLVFGYLPARKAATLDPAVALATA
jgi:macrolide transport system ATP-binding/permease protein